MNLQSSTALALSVVLLWTLSALPAPDFEFPEFSLGLIHKLAKKETRALVSQTQYAELASARNEINHEELLFLGDVMLARHVELLMNIHGPDFPYRQLEDFASETSAVFANFESSVSKEHQMTPPYNLRFSTNPLYLSALAEAGVTHVSLANNHSYDYGTEGYFNAVELLLQEDIEVVGCAQKLDCERVNYLEISGRTVAVVAVNTLERGAGATAEVLLREASSRSEFQVVFVHWGEEYVLTHNGSQYAQAVNWIDAGADLIVGHHPHVVQDIQLIEGVPVFYSLGNFIFDQYFSLDVKTGLALKLSFERDPRVELIPIDATTLGQPRIMKGDQKAVFLYELGERSDRRLTRHIRFGEIPLQLSVASSSKTAMIQR